MTTTAMPPDEPEEPLVAGSPVHGQIYQASGDVHVFYSSATPAPRQLPVSPSSFVGRQAELARIVAGVDEAEAPITLISGMPGVGKTALAVHWAHLVADRFPDGQLFVDMHGYDTAGVPLSPDDALGFLLHALGVAPDAVPADLDARAAVFRSLSSSRRLLIVLDNVAADEQVLPLLPGTGPSALVVTSRKRMNRLTATLSVTTIVLDPLPLDDSMALFIQVVGEERVRGEPDAATALVALCAGLPLALRIVGALVQTRPHTPLAELRNSFAHRSNRLLSEGADDGQTSLTAVLSWSYAALSHDAARLLRLLGLYENEIVTEAEAAALGDLSPSDAASLLNQLRAHNMLDGYDQGYVLHPLVHSYARQLVFREEGEEERAAAERRLSAVTGQPRQNVDWVNDAPATTDRLNRGVLADVLALRLRQAQREQPDISFLVHLDGPWGAGKTTLLNLLAHRLATQPDGSLVVTFDAWRHAKVDPPWWALITCLRDQLIRAAPWWGRPATRAREIIARVTRSGASYLLALVILVLMVVGVVAMLGPISLTPTKFGELAKALAAALTVVAGFWTAGKVATKLLLWDSARGARLFEQAHTNPMQDVTAHFAWLVEHSPRPVVFFIDDLDRCDEKFVIGILDAVQNLVRDASRDSRRPRRAAAFVVAADGAWLRRAYEKTYENFEGAVDEPGRPLGYLFLDKLFQLSVPMPAMGVETQSGYLGTLLGVDSGTATPKATDEIQELRARVMSGRSELDVLKALNDADPVARQAVVTDAIARMSAPEITTSTEHALQRFAPMLLANPRSMKRFVNTYSVLRILRTLEGGTVPLDALAVWTAIRIRWPLLADHLQHDADLIEKVKAAEEAITVVDLPKPLRKLVRQPAVRKFLEGAPVDLTPTVIRSCCGGQVG